MTVWCVVCYLLSRLIDHVSVSKNLHWAVLHLALHLGEHAIVVMGCDACYLIREGLTLIAP